MSSEWSVKDCKGCYYLKEGMCWYKNYPVDIPEDMCIEMSLQEGEED